MAPTPGEQNVFYKSSIGMCAWRVGTRPNPHRDVGVTSLGAPPTPMGTDTRSCWMVTELTNSYSRMSSGEAQSDMNVVFIAKGDERG